MNTRELAKIYDVSTLGSGMRTARPSNVTAKLAKYELRDVFRSRWLIVYALFFAVLAEGLLRFGGGTAQALVGLTNVVLLLVPLVGIVFGTMYLYSARDYIELLLSQPVSRSQLFGGLYAGLVLPLAGSFAAGVSLPFLMRGFAAADAGAFVAVLAAGTFLTLVFVGLAFPIAVRNDERVRGLAIALGAWLGLAVMYDAAVLLVLQVAAEYPLEIPALVMTVLNPVDLARTLLLLQFDVAALMGYTGAVFEKFFGGSFGTFVAAGALVLWSILPYVVGRNLFMRKDF